MTFSMGRIGFSTTDISPRRLAHAVGAAALGASLCFWGYVLRDPQAQPRQAPAVVAQAADPASESVAAWLGPGDVRLDVKVLGLATRQDGYAVALLSVNGAPPKVVMAGQPLMDDVVVRAIGAGEVMLARGGSLIRIAAPRLPEDDGKGIVRMP